METVRGIGNPRRNDQERGIRQGGRLSIKPPPEIGKVRRTAPPTAAEKTKPTTAASPSSRRSWPQARVPSRSRENIARQDGIKGRQYSLEQAVSDRAQLHTIAFDGLAFLTGDFGLDTFLPPGKVSDYFGFQYMRDIDAKGGGHNTSFLTRIANNMLAILNDDQKAQLLALGQEQENDIRRFAEMRLPLIKAFRRNLEGDLPAGSKGLDKKRGHEVFGRPV